MSWQALLPLFNSVASSSKLSLRRAILRLVVMSPLAGVKMEFSPFHFNPAKEIVMTNSSFCGRLSGYNNLSPLIPFTERDRLA